MKKIVLEHMYYLDMIKLAKPHFDKNEVMPLKTFFLCELVNDTTIRAQFFGSGNCSALDCLVPVNKTEGIAKYDIFYLPYLPTTKGEAIGVAFEIDEKTTSVKFIDKNTRIITVDTPEQTTPKTFFIEAPTVGYINEGSAIYNRKVLIKLLKSLDSDLVGFRLTKEVYPTLHINANGSRQRAMLLGVRDDKEKYR